MPAHWRGHARAALLVVFAALAACAHAQAGSCVGEQCVNDAGQGAVSATGEYDETRHPDGVMRAMWLTPLYTVALRDTMPASVNHNLANFAVRAHGDFVSWWGDAEANSNQEGGGPTVATDAFYSWQQRHGLDPRGAVAAELAQVKRAFLRSCFAFAASLGWDVAALETMWSLDDVEMWLGVMRPGDYHPAHVHKSSVLSGTYYVSVPPGSGSIVFRDPRGALPPFQHTFHHAPDVGDLLVFPSWLVHEVEPTSSPRQGPARSPEDDVRVGGDDTADAARLRIAVSFNLAGDWESTSDVSVAFPA